jgi:hypothetical protein
VKQPPYLTLWVLTLIMVKFLDVTDEPWPVILAAAAVVPLAITFGTIVAFDMARTMRKDADKN